MSVINELIACLETISLAITSKGGTISLKTYNCFKNLFFRIQKECFTYGTLALLEECLENLFKQCQEDLTTIPTRLSQILILVVTKGEFKRYLPGVARFWPVVINTELDLKDKTIVREVVLDLISDSLTRWLSGILLSKDPVGCNFKFCSDIVGTTFPSVVEDLLERKSDFTVSNYLLDISSRTENDIECGVSSTFLRKDRGSFKKICRLLSENGTEFENVFQLDEFIFTQQRIEKSFPGGDLLLLQIIGTVLIVWFSENETFSLSYFELRELHYLDFLEDGLIRFVFNQQPEFWNYDRVSDEKSGPFIIELKLRTLHQMNSFNSYVEKARGKTSFRFAILDIIKTKTLAQPISKQASDRKDRRRTSSDRLKSVPVLSQNDQPLVASANKCSFNQGQMTSKLPKQIRDQAPKSSQIGHSVATSNSPANITPSVLARNLQCASKRYGKVSKKRGSKDIWEFSSSPISASPHKKRHVPVHNNQLISDIAPDSQPTPTPLPKTITKRKPFSSPFEGSKRPTVLKSDSQNVRNDIETQPPLNPIQSNASKFRQSKSACTKMPPSKQEVSTDEHRSLHTESVISSNVTGSDLDLIANSTLMEERKRIREECHSINKEAFDSKEHKPADMTSCFYETTEKTSLLEMNLPREAEFDIDKQYSQISQGLNLFSNNILRHIRALEFDIKQKEEELRNDLEVQFNNLKRNHFDNLQKFNLYVSKRSEELFSKFC